MSHIMRESIVEIYRKLGIPPVGLIVVGEGWEGIDHTWASTGD